MLRAFNLAVAALASLGLIALRPARAHEIYTGLKDKAGHLCCGGQDCSLTTFRERGSAYEFKTREGHWVPIPQDRITFLPIPGDPPADNSHAAHLCYSVPMGYDRASDNYYASVDGAQGIVLYCAFIPPGGT